MNLKAVNGEENNQSHAEVSESSDDEDTQPTDVNVNEQNFQFMDFVKKFAKPKIVYACCLLLSQFEKNTTYTNHCILKLLHRIAFDCKYAAILFQASLFRTFQRILDSDKEEHKELKKFAIYIIRNFTEIAQKNGKVYMELLFWKGNKEAYEIVEGYGSMTSGNSGKVAWTEEQEDEVHRLFEEYQRDKPDQDLVDWIHSNLIDQSRSKRGLIFKMRELDLLEGPQKRINVNRKPPKEISEEEISQITELFNEFKEAFDIVGCIMERLDVKRPKKRIIDKIVELGLVQDRKELRKKRLRKSDGVRNNNEDSDERELDTDSDSDSDTENRNTTSNDLLNVPHYLSATEVIKNVKESISYGMKDAVEWILSLFQEVLEDLGEEESDVPILPMTDYSIKAMNNHIFQHLLIAIGIKRPQDCQEMYWRIPGTWQGNDLRKRISLINDGLNENTDSGELINNDFDENVTKQDGLPRLENEISTEFLTSENNIRAPQNEPVSLNTSENILENNVFQNDHNHIIQSKKRKRFDAEKFKNRNYEIDDRVEKKKKVRRILDDSDSDENMLESITESYTETSASRTLGNFNNDSDSENNSSITMKETLKKRILSSDESDVESVIFESINANSPMKNKISPAIISPNNKSEKDN